MSGTLPCASWLGRRSWNPVPLVRMLERAGRCAAECRGSYVRSRRRRAARQLAPGIYLAQVAGAEWCGARARSTGSANILCEYRYRISAQREAHSGRRGGMMVEAVI
jgi:hypothetical protein